MLAPVGENNFFILLFINYNLLSSMICNSDHADLFLKFTTPLKYFYILTGIMMCYSSKDNKYFLHNVIPHTIMLWRFLCVYVF